MAMTRGERNVLFHSAWFKITAGVIDCAIKNETASCDWHKRAHMRPLETHELNLRRNSSQHQSTKVTKETSTGFKASHSRECAPKFCHKIFALLAYPVPNKAQFSTGDGKHVKVIKKSRQPA